MLSRLAHFGWIEMRGENLTRSEHFSRYGQWKGRAERSPPAGTIAAWDKNRRRVLSTGLVVGGVLSTLSALGIVAILAWAWRRGGS
jgi:hypothetical protein